VGLVHPRLTHDMGPDDGSLPSLSVLLHPCRTPKDAMSATWAAWYSCRAGRPARTARATLRRRSIAEWINDLDALMNDCSLGDGLKDFFCALVSAL
jgi:hypothetical protein